MVIKTKNPFLPHFLFRVAFCLSLFFCFAGTPSYAQEDPKVKELRQGTLKLMLEQGRKNFPVEYAEGVKIDNVYLLEDTVVLQMKVSPAWVNSMDERTRKEWFGVQKTMTLAGFVSTDSYSILTIMLYNGLYVRYHFDDSRDKSLYDFVISPNDYTRAFEESGPSSTLSIAFELILEKCKKSLPMPIFGTCTLKDIQSELENKRLIFTVMYPPLKKGEVLPSDEEVKAFLLSNKKVIASEELTQVAVDCGLNLCFRFLDHNGKEHTTVTLPYASFSTTK